MSQTSQSQVQRSSGGKGVTRPIHFRPLSGEHDSKKQRPNVIRKGITGTGMDYNKKPVLEEDDYPGKIVWYDVEGADEEYEYPMGPHDKWIVNLESTYNEWKKSMEERARTHGGNVEEDGTVKYGVWLLLVRDAPYCSHCKKEGEHDTWLCPITYPDSCDEATMEK